MPANLRIVFSDVDGALIHYPEDVELFAEEGGDVGNEILALPSSATGMRGAISSKTLAACRDLRREGTLLVLISGMRTSTLLGRLPYLPRADAYCTEAGGRIFYPTEVDACCDRHDESADDENNGGAFPFREATPLPYSGSGPEDLEPFGLREEAEWRRRMEAPRAAGRDGYPGNEVHSDRCDAPFDDDGECPIDYDNSFGFPEPSRVVPLEERNEGALWDFARKLQRDEGLILDTRSYSTCFRVNERHQTTSGVGGGDGTERFRALRDGRIALPSGLAKSTNLGCVDVYPASSGKLNCCRYIARKLGVDMAAEAVCVCDDDNDIEMALGCAHAFVPALTSAAVAEAVERHPTRFTQTYRRGEVESTAATEAALRAIRDSAASASANEEALRLAEDDVPSSVARGN